MWPRAYTALSNVLSGRTTNDLTNDLNTLPHMNTQLDELKKRWKGLESAAEASALGQESAMRAADGSARSRRNWLIRCYRLLCIVAAVWIPMAPMVFCRVGMPVWVCCVTAAYFGLASGFCFYVMHKLKALDLSRMTTVDLLCSVREIIATRLRMKLVMIGCPFARGATLLLQAEHSYARRRYRRRCRRRHHRLHSGLQNPSQSARTLPRTYGSLRMIVLSVLYKRPH